MLKLYKSGNSICTQKVVITLGEKELDYDTQNINLFNNEQYDPEYLKLNPKGVVPTLDHGGNIVCESTLICEYLDDCFPAPRLIPDDPFLRTQMRLWSKAIDEGIFEATRELSFSAMFRENMKKMTEEQRQTRFRNIGDPERRSRYISTYEEGVESPYVFQAIAHYEKTFKNMEAALKKSGGPWLLGEKYSLADINMMPYVARLEFLDILDVWLDDRPLTRDWWDLAQTRPTFQTAVLGPLSDDELAAMKTHGGAMRDRIAEKRGEYLSGLT